jgi:hypothetical protein
MEVSAYGVLPIDDQFFVQSDHTLSSVQRNQKIGVSGEKMSSTQCKDEAGLTALPGEGVTDCFMYR